MALFKPSLNLLLRSSSRLLCTAPKFRKKRTETLVSVNNGSQEWQSMLSRISNGEIRYSEQWAGVREEIRNTSRLINEHNIDATIVNMCIKANKFDVAKSYLNFLNENKQEINIATVGKYLKLFYNCNRDVVEADKKQILSMYEKLRQRNPVLDAVTTENCIHAISLTERWQDCLELLEMVKITCSVSSSAYSAIITAAFNNDNSEIGWRYLEEMLLQEKLPHHHVYSAYLHYCLRMFKEEDSCIKGMEKMFEFCAENDLKPGKEFMEEIVEAYKKFGWTGRFTTLNNKGFCKCCKHQLSSLKLASEEFSNLSRTILEKVIIGRNLYSKTTPEELKELIRFVEKTKPYDVVVDGLNIAYARCNGPRNPQVMVQQLATVVKYFVDQKKNVLVLGRKHMNKWPKKEMQYMRNNAHVFLANNLSEDDPCLLYATLSSGEKTDFISRDLMREHRFLLEDPHLKRTFKHWQMSHQYFLIYAGVNNVIVKKPLSYLPVAQGDKSCWHIPYDIEPLTCPPQTFEPPSTWLCLRRNK